MFNHPFFTAVYNFSILASTRLYNLAWWWSCFIVASTVQFLKAGSFHSCCDSTRNISLLHVNSTSDFSLMTFPQQTCESRVWRSIWQMRVEYYWTNDMGLCLHAFYLSFVYDKSVWETRTQQISTQKFVHRIYFVRNLRTAACSLRLSWVNFVVV